MNLEKLQINIEESIKNPRRWKDPYDAEKIQNRYIRGVLKRINLFTPNLFYQLNIFDINEWDENYIMLGQAALNLDRRDLVEISLDKLKISFKNHWGLPIDWHSGEYIFPKNMLMSTTTSECLLYLCNVYEVYPDLIKVKYLEEAAEYIIRSLKRNKIEGTSEYLYSYTPIDYYRVFNSNLLVAAAIGKIGVLAENSELLKEAANIYSVCERYIPSAGYIPYSIYGKEESADSYHQLFSMRAVYFLEKEKVVDPILLERIESYFFEKFLIDGNVVLKPGKSTLDLQSYSEALRYFGVSKNKKAYERLYESRFILMKRDKYIQRVWKYKSRMRIKSNACHSRQGYLRLLLALSYRYSL